MDFLKNITFKDISECDEKVIGSVVDFGEVNRVSCIPFRFAETVLGHSENDEKMRRFVLKEKSDRVLLLAGNIGTGKTTLLCGGMHERAINGLNAGLYLSCRTLGPKIRASRSFSARVNEEELYDIYAKTPFLVLDEFGQCDDMNLEKVFVSTLLALRYDNCLRTAIATNFSAHSVREYLNRNGEGKDIVDRLSSVLEVITLDGDSLRQGFKQ